MKTFKTYLHEQDYAKETIASYCRYVELFQHWLASKNYDPEQMDYKSCLEYVKKLQERSYRKTKSKSTVRHHVGGLKIYFNYLIDENLRATNPMQRMNIRGAKRSLNHNLLEFEELEDLYYSYKTENIVFPNCPSVAIRNKVITGLMVYQGLNATALKSLKYEHISIDKGTIYIPSTRKTNSRELELKSWQMILLLQYLEKDRDLLQEKINCYTDKLFPIRNNRFYITHTLFKALRKFNHKVRDVKQIRASVLTYWLSRYNIREVQYMAGHRYISSTERYVQDDLENLQEIIENLHPIF